MWTVLQIAVCVVFLLFSAFWAGKKIGQRRFYKIQEEMKALELYFKHLMEDMEMVSNHNMKVLEASTTELKELLSVADKKCLYAGDLLREIDEGTEGLKRRNLNSPTGVTSIDSGADKKFRREVQEALEELLKKLVKLSERVTDLEIEAPEGSPTSEELLDIIKEEVARQMKSLRLEKEWAEETAKMAANANDKNIEKTVERVVALKPSREAFSSGAAAVERVAVPARPANITELKTASIDEKARVPGVVKKTDLEKAVPAPPAGYPVREVLELFSKGVSLPQIARSLNMGKGEIELILKIYGEGINMRKIM